MDATARPGAVSEDEPTPRRVRPHVSVAGILVAMIGLLVLAAGVVFRDTAVTAGHYVGLSVILFAVGAFGVMIRRNALVLFMCIELMLNAANLAFVAFARMHGRIEGQGVVLFVMVVAAAEVAVGLAIIVSIYRRRLSANVDEVSLLKW